MANRISRNAARKAAMAERRERQLARKPGFFPIRRTRNTPAASQTYIVRKAG